MHTLTSGDSIFHHSNFSGEVHVIVTTKPEKLPSFEDEPARWKVLVPFEDLRYLVAEYVRQRRIELLEAASDDDVLGIAEPAGARRLTFLEPLAQGGIVDLRLREGEEDA
jgi:hypothetical protein